MRNESPFLLNKSSKNKSPWQHTFGNGEKQSAFRAGSPKNLQIDSNYLQQNYGMRQLAPINQQKQNSTQKAARTQQQNSLIYLPPVHQNQARYSHSPHQAPLSSDNFNEIGVSIEQQKILKELHEIQQKELENVIKRQQEQQLQLLESWMQQQIENKNKKIFGYRKKSPTDDESKGDNKFKPYTLKQYQMLKVQQPVVTGGLGPTMTEDKWFYFYLSYKVLRRESKDKVNKMLEFSEQVKVYNKQKIVPKQKPEILKEKSKREIAIEFAKGIPKPRNHRGDSIIDQELQDSLRVIQEREELQDDDMIKMFEQRNAHYRQQIEETRKK